MTEVRALFINRSGACLIFPVPTKGPHPYIKGEHIYHPTIRLTQGRRLVQEAFLGCYTLYGKSRSGAVVYLMQERPLDPPPGALPY